MVNHRPLRLAFWLAGLVANPFESSCGDQAHDQKVAPAKGGGVFPRVSILVGPLEGHVEHGTFVGVLCPDARADGAVTDLVDGLVVRITERCLIFHDSFVLLVSSGPPRPSYRMASRQERRRELPFAAMPHRLLIKACLPAMEKSSASSIGSAWPR